MLTKHFRSELFDDSGNVAGCCVLSNGKMVFTIISPGEVIIFHKDGTRDFTINIRSWNPCDVTCIDSNTLAVFVVEIDTQVRIIDLKQSSVTKKINIYSMVNGTTYNDGFLICCAVDKGLIRIDLKCNSITPVASCSLSYWSYVTTNGNIIYYTNDRTGRVTCSAMNGKVKWEFYDKNG